MPPEIVELASKEWEAGRPLEAGRILFEHLPEAQRPGWAAAALELVRPRFQAIPAVEAVLAIARDPTRWGEAHRAFQAVRKVTLRVERNWRPNRQLYAYLMLAENPAKMTYNASGSAAPFDADSGWWVARCLQDVVTLLGDSDLQARAWETLVANLA